MSLMDYVMHPIAQRARENRDHKTDAPRWVEIKYEELVAGELSHKFVIVKNQRTQNATAEQAEYQRGGQSDRLDRRATG